MTKYRMLLVATAVSTLACLEAGAQWIPLAGNLYDQNIRSIAVHPRRPDILYAGAKGFLYCSTDAGISWKRVLKLASALSEVNVIRLDRVNPDLIYVGTDEGGYRSDDSGKKWRRFFERAEENEEKVTALGIDESRRDRLLVGTASGLFVTRDDGTTWTTAPQFTGRRVFQISPDGSGAFFAASTRGLYTADGDLMAWRRLYADASGAKREENASAPFEAEEITIRQDRYAFLVRPVANEIVLVHDRDILLSRDGGNSWKQEPAALPSPVAGEIAALGYDEDRIFIPTDRGLFHHDLRSGKTIAAGWGLPSSGIRGVVHDEAEDSLFAATEKGIFKMPYPGTTVFLKAQKGNIEFKTAEVLAFFRHEPSILELQNAAVRYAEVHPDKITAWRNGASAKAWVPTLTVGHDWDADRNVDIDRGGTGDPDQFIDGPDERGRALSVDLSWDFSELVWNPDQTSIDNRSKLMAQLRDDVLNQLNHLYFARRRLQVQEILSPTENISQVVEHQLQIDEYTAGIDALTGGYLSRALGEEAARRGPE